MWHDFQVVISGLSSAAVLTDDGIINFAHALNLYAICLLLAKAIMNACYFAVQPNAPVFTLVILSPPIWETAMGLSTKPYY